MEAAHTSEIRYMRTMRAEKTGEVIAGLRKRVKLLIGLSPGKASMYCTCQMWSQSSPADAAGSR